MKELKLTCHVEHDDYDDRDTYQEINSQEHNICFSVCNLEWNPEDAIIGRSLFTADDYIQALNKGIELAKKGYDKVIYERVVNEDK